MIRTIQDLEVEIAKLRDRVDVLYTKDIDLHGRRVFNASSAIRGNEYTTFDQVQTLLDRIKTPATQLFEGMLQVDFSISVPSVGDDISAQYPVIHLPKDQLGIPIFCGARLKVSPDSGSLSIRWNHVSKDSGNTTDLFNGSLLSIPTGSTWGFLTVFQPNIKLATGDYFTIDCTASNNAAGLYTFLSMEVV